MKIVIFLSLLPMSFISSSLANCTDRSRIEISYINGVQNTLAQSKSSADRIMFALDKNNNFLKAQIPTRSDMCVTSLYNQTYGLIDFVELAGQKLRENASIPFDWKNVSNYIFNKSKFMLIGYTLDQTLDLIDEEIRTRAAEQESDTLQEITKQAKESLLLRPLIIVSHSQGTLFANQLIQNLRLDPELNDKRYGSFMVGAAAGAYGYNGTRYPRRLLYKLKR